MFQENRVNKILRVSMAEMAGMERGEQRETEERPGCQETWERGDCQVFGDLPEYLVPGGQWGRRAIMVPLVWLVLKVCLVHRVQQQEEEQSTLAGGEPRVHLTREQHLSTLEELGDLATPIMEVQPIFSVCLMILSTHVMRVEYKVIVPSGEQSIKHVQTSHLEGKTTTTYRVQFVVPPSEVNY